MQIIDRGHGDPLMLIPGLQGRWEYVRPALDALAEHYRVLTCSLGDERTSGWAFDAARGLDSFADHVVAVLDDRGLRRAVICGVSFGGLVALRVAARYPHRASALVLASTPGPRWRLRPRHTVYARAPWLFGPLFLAESPFRLRAELAAALPDARERWRFGRDQLRTLVEAPLSVTRMAARARMVACHDRAADCRDVACPTLIVHGEEALDHVVDAGGTSDYGALIHGATVVTLERTGHLGSITRPREFAAITRRFLTTQRGSHDTAA